MSIRHDVQMNKITAKFLYMVLKVEDCHEEKETGW